MRHNPSPLKKRQKRWKIRLAIIISLSIIFILLLIKIFPWGIFKIKHHDINIVDNLDKTGEIEIVPLPAENIDESKGRNPGLIKNMVPLVKKAKKDPDVLNILLLGLDGNDYKRRNRSDSMMMISVNRRSGSIKMVSFMRDTKVKLPNFSNFCKLNEVYAYGGPGNTINTINYLYDLDIQKYIIVDFSHFSNVVDVAGGVEINVKEKEVSHIPGLKKAGKHMLNGIQAFEYSRIRKIDSDWVRTSRQRNVMTALIDKFMKTDIIKKRDIIDKMMTLCTTNFSLSELITLGIDSIGSLNTSSIEQYTCPDPYKSGIYYKDNGSYITVDFNKQKVALHNFIYDDKNKIPGGAPSFFDESSSLSSPSSYSGCEYESGSYGNSSDIGISGYESNDFYSGSSDFSSGYSIFAPSDLHSSSDYISQSSESFTSSSDSHSDAESKSSSSSESSTVSDVVEHLFQ